MENSERTVCTVRLLNSPFAGCEYPILKGRTFFVIGGDAIFNGQGGISDLPSDTIFIPFENDGVNFEIICDDAGGILLREIRAGATTERNDIVQNHPVEIGMLKVAFRSTESVWDPGILQYSELTEKISHHNRKLFRTIFCTLFGTLLLVASAFAYFLTAAHTEKEVKSLNALLENNIDRFNVLKGQDGIIYVLSRDERDAVWAKQALEKTGNTAPVRVTSYTQESQKFDKWMKDYFPGILYYRLQMDNPRAPQFWISQKSVVLNEKTLGILKKKRLKFSPIYSVWMFPALMTILL